MTTSLLTLSAHLQALPDGSLLRAASLLAWGNRRLVRAALASALAEGTLLKVTGGLYARPIHNRFGSLGPVPPEVVAHWASTTNEVFVLQGAAAAHGFGLTTQVPCGYAYLTSGRSREVNVGKFLVRFRHAPAWLLNPSAAGAAVRALESMGPTYAPSAMARLRGILSEEHLAELVALGPSLPTWLAQVVATPVPSAEMKP